MRSKTTPPAVTADISRVRILQLAGAAVCDPRTARRYFLGEPIKGIVGERVAQAAQDLGFAGDQRARS